MFNRIIKYKFWISGGIIIFLGIWFLGAMFKMIGVSGAETHKVSLLNQAEQFCLEGKYKKALDLYERILILNPDSSEAVLKLAIIYDDYINNDSKAVELYKEYLKLEPESNKKTFIEGWIVDSARESLGMQTKTKNNKTYESKLTKLEKELKTAIDEKSNLEEQVEELSAKLYNIQSEHQAEIQEFQKQRERLASLVTLSRMRISDLTKALRNAQKEKQYKNKISALNSDAKWKVKDTKN